MEHKITRKGRYKVENFSKHNTPEEAIQAATNKAIELNRVVTITPPSYEVEVVGLGENLGQNLSENIGTAGGLPVSGAQHVMLPWSVSFEQGDDSEFNQSPYGNGGTVTTALSYSGSYSLQASVSGTDQYEYHIFGPPNQLGPLITEFYFQIAVTHDDFAGAWAQPLKLLLFNFTDGTNTFREYQCILYAGGFDAPSSENFSIELLQWTNSGNTFVTSDGYNISNSAALINRDSWDVVRGYVKLNTTHDGSGILGTGHGNGAIQIWVNNTLVLEDDTCNFRNGSSVGLGRCILTMDQAGAWSGPTFNRYVDSIYVSDLITDLPAMPTAPVARGGGSSWSTPIVIYNMDTTADTTDPNAAGSEYTWVNNTGGSYGSSANRGNNTILTPFSSGAWDGGRFLRCTYQSTSGQDDGGFQWYMANSGIRTTFSIGVICRYGPSFWTHNADAKMFIAVTGEPNASTRLWEHSPTLFTPQGDDGSNIPALDCLPGGRGFDETSPDGFDVNIGYYDHPTPAGGWTWTYNDSSNEWFYKQIHGTFGGDIYLTVMLRDGTIHSNIVHSDMTREYSDGSNTYLHRARLWAYTYPQGTTDANCYVDCSHFFASAGPEPMNAPAGFFL